MHIDFGGTYKYLRALLYPALGCHMPFVYVGFIYIYYAASFLSYIFDSIEVLEPYLFRTRRFLVNTS